MSTKDRVLVYSTDPKDQDILTGKADKDKELVRVNELVLKNNFTCIFRIESKGRGGKTVTVIEHLPAHETFIKELTKVLKSKCGVGGSSFIKDGVGTIEVQGDKREAIKKIFDSKGIKYKGM